jgi:hypothetical protein
MNTTAKSKAVRVIAKQFKTFARQVVISAQRPALHDASAGSGLFSREATTIKTIVMLWTFAAFVFHSHGQPESGTIFFANNSQTVLTNSAGTPHPPAGSSAYSVGLYWGTLGTPEGSLELLPASNNGVTRTWSADGRFLGGIARFPLPGGTQIALQVRLWSGLSSSYEDAVLNDPSAVLARGIVQQIILGNAPGTVPTPPTDMNAPTGVGDTPFQAFLVPVVPEPSAGLLLLLALPFFAARWIQLRGARK